MLQLNPSRPALVIACVALLASLSGTAVALPGKRSIDKNDFGTGVITTKAIRDQGIATKDLKDRIITSSKLAPRSVVTSALADGAVTGRQLASNAVSAGEIARNAVSDDEIASNSVSDDELEPNSVTGNELSPNSVDADEIAVDGVRGDEIGNDSVGGAELTNGAVTSNEIGGVTVRTATVSVPGNTPNGAYSTRAVTASCARDELAIGGGTSWSSDGDNEELVTVYQRYDTDGSGRPTGIRARGGTDVGSARTFTVQVLCLAP